MPRAEVGSNKYVANKMKAKGLTRLRWYCQVCEKACRDANGFKCHCQSESHVRQMQAVGEDPKKFIQGFSNDFQRDFVALLRTAHGEKWVGVNRYYNEYIRDKDHLHMNATKWSSLTEFTKHLAREGIVNVKEDEKDGLMISWRDVSVQAVRRREEIRAQEAAEARSGAGEDKMLRRMAQRAKEEAEVKARAAEARKEAAAKTSQSPPQDTDSPEPTDVLATATAEDAAKTDDDATSKVEATPVKISFGMQAKVPQGKAGLRGLGQMKSKSIFKRARADDREDKHAKKVKL